MKNILILTVLACFITQAGYSSDDYDNRGSRDNSSHFSGNRGGDEQRDFEQNKAQKAKSREKRFKGKQRSAAKVARAGKKDGRK